MFEKLFLSLGNIVLNIYMLIINFKFPSFKASKEKEVKTYDITQIKTEEHEVFNNFRSIILNNILSTKVLLLLTLIDLILLISIGFEISLILACGQDSLLILLRLAAEQTLRRNADDACLDAVGSQQLSTSFEGRNLRS